MSEVAPIMLVSRHGHSSTHSHFIFGRWPALELARHRPPLAPRRPRPRPRRSRSRHGGHRSAAAAHLQTATIGRRSHRKTSITKAAARRQWRPWRRSWRELPAVVGADGNRAPPPPPRQSRRPATAAPRLRRPRRAVPPPPPPPPRPTIKRTPRAPRRWHRQHCVGGVGDVATLAVDRDVSRAGVAVSAAPSHRRGCSTARLRRSDRGRRPREKDQLFLVRTTRTTTRIGNNWPRVRNRRHVIAVGRSAGVRRGRDRREQIATVRFRQELKLGLTETAHLEL